MSLITQIRGSVVDAYLGNFARTPLVNPAWEIDAAETEGVSIRWPANYEWAAASDWVDVLRAGFRSYVPVEMADDIPQPYEGTVVIEVGVEGTPRRVAIGYSDYRPIDDDCARSVDLYFKMQYDARGYAVENVVPGGYVPDGKRLYFHLDGLRRLRDRREYCFDVYGRFGLKYAREVRERAVNILNAQNSFGFEGGMKKVSYKEFLTEAARSRICLDLPGLGGFCFRLVNYLAVGSCIIAYPHGNLLNAPLIDRKHVVYCKPDFSDLVELCEYYLENDGEREEIAQNAREFFDLNLHKDNLVRYYLRTCLDRFQ